jgi:pantetheine-phosphate adenylyltransferase
MMTERIGLYPGTFDPFTLGHADIMRRGAKLVDRLIVGVTTNPSKDPMFTPAERMEMVAGEVERLGLANVEIKGFDALLMDVAEREKAAIIVRGLRAVADFEYEYQMAGMNQQLNASIETVFLMADISLQPIASKLVKEIAFYGGDISRFLSPPVARQVVERVDRIGRKGDRQA